MEQIEEKEIRGVSLRTVRWIVGSTVTIISTVLMSYFGIKESILNLNTQNSIQDLRIKTAEIRLDRIDAEIDILNNKVEENKATIIENKHENQQEGH